MKTCKKCACAENPDDAIYCRNCGAKITRKKSEKMYFRCSFHSYWHPVAMQSTGDGRWEVTMDVPAGKQEFKFSNTADWKGKNWGGSSGFAGKLKENVVDNTVISTTKAATYKFVFDENTLKYEVSQVEKDFLFYQISGSVIVTASIFAIWYLLIFDRVTSISGKNVFVITAMAVTLLLWLLNYIWTGKWDWD